MAMNPTEVLELMPFANTLGIELSEVDPQRVVGRLAWAPELCTAAGLLHGGVVMALADSLGGICAYLNLPSGATTATVNSSTNFFRPVTGGTLTGICTPMHVGHQVIVAQTDLVDKRERRVAQVTQTQAVIIR
jgi:1,4-dihydroxy-2-naphthoyl-CoA hydrolase